MTKRTLVLGLLILCSAPSVGFAQTQSIYPNTTLKTALVDYLYQYGKEIYLRGIDPQEASYVLQRALVLDCHHQGAQTYLNKLHQKYPDVSVRIWGCAPEEAPLAEEAQPAVSQKKEETNGELRNARKAERLSRTKQKETTPAKTAKESIKPSKDSAQTDPSIAAPVADSIKEDMTASSVMDETSKVEKVKKDNKAKKAPAVAKDDNAALRQDFKDAENEMEALKNELKQKDEVIARYKSRLAARNFSEDMDDFAYSKLARDQKELIRIQQNNIDYLKSELAEVKKQGSGGAPSSEAYTKNQIQVADSGLEAQEQKIAAEFKDQEARDLRQRLLELQEQLALVQKLVDEKNKTIESLEHELRAVEPMPSHPVNNAPTDTPANASENLPENPSDNPVVNP